MSEAIIVKRGRSGGDIPGLVQTLVTNIITTNTTFQVPNAINNTFFVRIFGGGGGGFHETGIFDAVGGGGSGWMNNGEFILNYGQSVYITIGKGGRSNYTKPTNGGTTSFGTYLSAVGGGAASAFKGGSGGSGGSGQGNYSNNYGKYEGGDGYQFGGGAGFNGGNGGNGGIWGGGGGGSNSYAYNGNLYFAGGNGGNGGTYGGGGGAIVISHHTDPFINIINKKGGNGGTYGGGGGGAIGGIGGTYGGNGGTREVMAEAGTDTSSWTNVYHDGNGYFRGTGAAGGIGRVYNNTLENAINSWFPNHENCYGGGGGGFGGRGGNSEKWALSGNYVCFGGGGGGYGGSGRDGDCIWKCCGGGGGYGGSGGRGGGGGYGNTATGGNTSPHGAGSGGGYYTRGTECTSDDGAPGVAYGEWGKGGTQANGTNGVCIIQYYIWSME